MRIPRFFVSTGSLAHSSTQGGSMKPFFKCLMCYLVLYASMTWGQQLAILNGPADTGYALFGSQVHSHGQIVVANDARLRLNSLKLKVEACSIWDQPATPFYNFQISDGSTSVNGQMEVVNSETFMTFPINATLTAGRRWYSITSNVADFPSFPSVNQKCFRMRLDQSGIDTSGSVTGNFPVRLRASTVVLTQPSVTIAVLGQTSNRVRQVVDNVFEVRVMNTSNNYPMWIKGIRLRFSGQAFPTNPYSLTFSLVDPETGFLVARGHYYSSGNAVWGEIVGGISYEQHALPASATRRYVVRVDSSAFNNSPKEPDSMTIEILNPCDLQWDTAGSNDSGPGLCLQSGDRAATVSYE